MSELKKTFDYEFRGNLNYIRNGEPVKAIMISIKAPTNKNLNDVIVIEQEFAKSQMNLLANLKDSLGGSEGIEKLAKSRNETEDKEQESTTESVLQQLLGGNADIKKCMSALKNILLSNVNGATAFIDETTPLNETIYNDFSYIDIKNILGEYILNFLLISPNR